MQIIYAADKRVTITPAPSAITSLPLALAVCFGTLVQFMHTSLIFIRYVESKVACVHITTTTLSENTSEGATQRV